MITINVLAYILFKKAWVEPFFDPPNLLSFSFGQKQQIPQYNCSEVAIATSIETNFLLQLQSNLDEYFDDD